MRISKFTLPVLTVAGALALAACGGGSDMDDDGNGANPGANPGSTTSTNANAQRLPDTTGLTNSSGEPYTIRIVKKADGTNGTHTTPNGTITCPADECVVTVGAEQGTPVVTATGGATYAAKPVVQAPTADRTAGRGDSTVDWLSDRNLVNAVKTRARTTTDRGGVEVVGITITGPRGAEHTLLREGASRIAVGPGGTFNSSVDTIEPTSGSEIGRVVIESPEVDGDDTTLRLVHTRGRTVVSADDTITDRDTTYSDYLVFGTWETVTSAGDAEADAPTNASVTGVLATGTLPVPASELPQRGDARYEGKALGHYDFHKGEGWEEWNGLVSLKANWTSGTDEITGFVRTTTAGLSDEFNNTGATYLQIDLDDGGKVSGVGSGTWNSDFYGSAINTIPSGIAGDFKTERKASAGGTFFVPQSDGSTKREERTAKSALTLQGAFGAHHVGQSLDNEQDTPDQNQ
ncbi:MAG: hypothetical protein OXD36_02040 [Rhodobacter sp.]|nr:hypothetical protein [Rhodobacter sp.]